MHDPSIKESRPSQEDTITIYGSNITPKLIFVILSNGKGKQTSRRYMHALTLIWAIGWCENLDVVRLKLELFHHGLGCYISTTSHINDERTHHPTHSTSSVKRMLSLCSRSSWEAIPLNTLLVISISASCRPSWTSYRASFKWSTFSSPLSFSCHSSNEA